MSALPTYKKMLQPGKTEYEVAWHIDSWLRQRGYSSAFDPIVAVNEHAAVPHFNTLRDGKKRIGHNAIALIDVGARVNNYCSDISRMFVVGKPSTIFMNSYTNMLKIQEQTIQQLGTCKKYCEVDTYCREELKKVGITPHAHATGHGIGIDVHEKPYISSHSKDTIVPGHVVTIEPGTYIDNKFGIRIEDTIYIDEDHNPTQLTKYPKRIA
ncbi:MAG: putative peptidase [Microgenomates bacterium OLB23]|nr:MAG: putative peptidase [Microgenomates bacterium OLB23]